MRPISRAACIAERIRAMTHCIETGTIEGESHHRAILDGIMTTAPSGSGFDNGTTLDHTNVDKLLFSTAFHHMNDVGMYDGWTEHDVIVKPTFRGISIRVTGTDRNDIKDYIGEVFHAWLTAEVDPGTGTPVPDARDDALTNGCRVLLTHRTPGGPAAVSGRVILAERGDSQLPFTVWWQRDSDQSLHHGNYCATIAEAAEIFAERARRGE